jgi:hypothetical protein
MSIYITDAKTDNNGHYAAYSCGTLQHDGLHATAADVKEYAGKSSLTPAELFFHRFGLVVPR